jgi:hypothetical protein
MDGKITCDCGVTLIKKQLSRHKKSKRHLDYINQKSLDLTNDDKEPEEAEISNDEVSEAETSNDEASEAEEEVIEAKEKPKGQTRNSNKFHLDAIRQKAIAKIKEKKQAKIDKEMEIIKKAEQYDALVKSLKDKEEDEKKRKEEERLKEMEYKSQQYDKMIKNQEKNNAIKTLSNEKIIDSVKQQRLEYLLRYLQNPNQY